MTRRITRLRRHVKALSPIFAVLILIAIAVIAGIIVYMFTSGYLGTMMGGGSAGQEKVALETVVVTDANASTVTVYAKSTGGGDVEIMEAILKDAAGNALDVDTAVTALLPADGTLTPVNCDFLGSLSPGSPYTVTIISKEGSQFVSPAFEG